MRKNLLIIFLISIQKCLCLNSTVKYYSLTKVLNHSLPHCLFCIRILTDDLEIQEEILKVVHDSYCQVYTHNIDNSSLSNHVDCLYTLIALKDSLKLMDLFETSEKYPAIPHITKKLFILNFDGIRRTFVEFDNFITRMGFEIIQLVIEIKSVEIDFGVIIEIRVDIIDVVDEVRDELFTDRLLSDIELNEFNFKQSMFLSSCVDPYIKPGVTVDVGVFDCPPYIEVNEETQMVDKGMEHVILEEVNKKLPIKYVIVDPIKERWAKILDDLFHGKIDIGACSLWLMHFEDDTIEPSISYSDNAVRLFVPNPQELSRLLLMIIPFDVSFWIMWIVIIVCTSLLTGIITKFLHKNTITNNDDLIYVNPSYSIWTILRIATFTTPLKFASNKESVMRVILIHWIWINFFVGSAYNSKYTASMTFPIYSKPVKTFEDMWKQGVTWLVHDDLTTAEHMKEANDPDLKIITQSLLIETNLTKSVPMIKTNKYGILLELTLDKYVINPFGVTSEYVKRNMHGLNRNLMTHSIVFGYVKNSPYKCFIDRKIQNLNEAGVLQMTLKKMLMQKKNTNETDEDFEDSKGAKALIFEDIKGAMILLGAGLSISTLALFGEIVLSRRIK